MEHPAEAFGYFRKEHVEKVICEQKHKGSRAVVIVCRDREPALRRFGVTQDEIGVCYTRTGRRFFHDGALEREFLGRIQAVVGKSGLWGELATDCLCLDCELMPWSSKAQDLLRQQYAPRGGGSRWTRSVDSCFADDQRACARSLRTDRTIRGTLNDGGALHRGISPLPLDCSLM